MFLKRLLLKPFKNECSFISFTESLQTKEKGEMCESCNFSPLLCNNFIVAYMDSILFRPRGYITITCLQNVAGWLLGNCLNLDSADKSDKKE